MTEVGHNSRKAGGVAVEQLRSIVERIEHLEEEKAAIAADIGDVFAEAKGNGWNLPAIRQILKLRKMDASERDEREAVVDTYRRCLGMLPQLDMFESENGAA